MATWPIMASRRLNLVKPPKSNRVEKVFRERARRDGEGERELWLNIWIQICFRGVWWRRSPGGWVLKHGYWVFFIFFFVFVVLLLPLSFPFDQCLFIKAIECVLKRFEVKYAGERERTQQSTHRVTWTWPGFKLIT